MAAPAAAVSPGMTHNLRPAERDADPISVFADTMFTYLQNVAAAQAPPAMAFSFGPLAVEMHIAGTTFRRRFTQAIEFAQLPLADQTGLSWLIIAIDGAATGIGDPPPWRFPVANPRHLERLHFSANLQLSVRYNPTTLTWTAISVARRLAIIWTADAAQLPDWDDSAPFRDLFHWMTLPTDYFLAHAAAIGSGRNGILLAGPGGCGKSTTTAAMVMHGLMTAGDDFVLVDPGAGRVHALYDTLKLDSRGSEWFPELAAHVANRNRESPAKSRIHLWRSRPSALAHQLPVDAILLPRAAGAPKTAITSATVAEAMRALVPSTICLVRGGEAETIRKSAAFLRKTPAYHCALGSDPSEAASTISEFAASLAR